MCQSTNCFWKVWKTWQHNYQYIPHIQRAQNDKINILEIWRIYIVWFLPTLTSTSYVIMYVREHYNMYICKSLNFGWSFIGGCSTISSTIIILYNIIHVITKKLQMFTFWDFFSDFTNTLLPIGRWHSFIVWLLSSIISFLEDSGNLLSVRENRLFKFTHSCLPL